MDENQEQPQLQTINELGSSIIETQRGTIHVLTIVGQIEGHQVLPPTSKSTKYEHVMPLLATVEEEFGVKFSMKAVQGLKNVGELADLIAEAL